MGVIYCRECGGKVAEKLAACPHCGGPIGTGGLRRRRKPVRWLRIVVLTFLIVALLGVPVAWVCGKGKFQAEAAIRVRPVVYSLVFTDEMADRVLPLYDQFKNTHAQLILREQVLCRVADEMRKRNDITLFGPPAEGLVGRLKAVWSTGDLRELVREKHNAMDALLGAMARGDLAAISDSDSELILIQMTSPSAREAEIIVSAFLRAYEQVVLAGVEGGNDVRLRVLEEQRLVLQKDVEQQESIIELMGEEYGATDLAEPRQLILERVRSVQEQLVTARAERTALETQIQLGAPGESIDLATMKQFKMREEFVNADERYKRLNERVIDAEEALIGAEQALGGNDPELAQSRKVLENWRAHLADRRAELDKTFDDRVAEVVSESQEERLTRSTALMGHCDRNIERLREELMQSTFDVIDIGRRYDAIMKRQSKLDRTRRFFDIISDRIMELRLESKRPARISVEPWVASTELPSRRGRMILVVLSAGLVCGLLLALLRWVWIRCSSGGLAVDDRPGTGERGADSECKSSGGVEGSDVKRDGVDDEMVYMRGHPPRCLGGEVGACSDGLRELLQGELGEHSSCFGVVCECGGTVFAVSRPIECGVTSIKCGGCGKARVLFDPTQYGYDGELGHNAGIELGEVEGYACSKCGKGTCEVAIGFQYSGETDVLKDDDAPDVRPEDLFGWVMVAARCDGCGGIEEVTQMECA